MNDKLSISVSAVRLRIRSYTNNYTFIKDGPLRTGRNLNFKMDVFDLSNLKDEVNYCLKIDATVMKVLISIRNIIDRGFFSTYYIKENLWDDLHSMMDDGDLDTRRTFSYSLNRHPGFTIEKCDVYSIIKTVGIGVVVEVCIQIALIFKKITINNYASKYDGNMLLDMSETIVQCILSFKSTSLFRMDNIEKCLTDFAVFLLKQITNADMNSFVEENGCFIRILMALILKYIRLPLIQSVILQEISTFLKNFNGFYNTKKIRRIEDLHFEILSVLLNILFEVLDTSNTDSLVRAVEFEQTRKGCAEDLCHALVALRELLPEYYGWYIERSIDLLSSAVRC